MPHKQQRNHHRSLTAGTRFFSPGFIAPCPLIFRKGHRSGDAWLVSPMLDVAPGSMREWFALPQIAFRAINDKVLPGS